MPENSEKKSMRFILKPKTVKTRYKSFLGSTLASENRSKNAMTEKPAMGKTSLNKRSGKRKLKTAYSSLQNLKAPIRVLYLNRHFTLNSWIRVVVFELKIIVSKRKDVLYLRIELH